MIRISLPWILSLTKGKEIPAKLLPPPAHPITTSGYSPAMASCFSASRPMMVWCMSTWLSTLPREYFVSFGRDRILDGFADGDTEASRMVRILLKELPSRIRVRARARHALPAPRLHHDPPVGLLIIADPHHVDLQSRPNWLQAKESALPHWPAPVSVVEPLNPRHLVVICLGNGRIRFVAPRRAHALVLEVDVGRCSEKLLQRIGPGKEGSAST